MKATSRRDKIERTDWRVYLIADPSALSAERVGAAAGQTDKDRRFSAILDVVRAALRGGAGVVQLRDKSATSRELVEYGRALQDVCDGFGALFVVNDRIDVALACGADGVHLGPKDIEVSEARRIAPRLVIGASSGDAEGARALVEGGADYLGVGAVYEARASKADASAPRGPGVLAEVRGAIGESVPMVGIGGVNVQNAAQVAAHGASGVAVIREIVAADEPELAARGLLQAVGPAREI
ncbi:thiamine phosphate synthase [Bradymonas sediminis]|uniref:Thiamine-phosphate synthase n=1 Tax=Bradymonas sediminis TaxID=1548548 RepID=A0A2Z4FMI4_9DELT|nr:thiamine phosphate synthase [Bradymonas sediminis]AWV90163.1 thiamine phosphate synthase [Bradymonas sediminis]TDP75870.1 thiamine-phosphate diphosphorylase [Bradymonas sediminis]